MVRWLVYSRERSRSMTDDERDASVEVIDENIVDSEQEGQELLDQLDTVGINRVETIDLEEMEEQQVLAIPDIENVTDNTTIIDTNSKQSINESKPAKDYKCPLCFDSPDPAMITTCGHIFCNACLFQMVNSSKANNKFEGNCALCRNKVRIRDVRMIILRKKRVPKGRIQKH